MVQTTHNSNKRTKGGWLTVGLLFALALCPPAFSAPVSYTYDNLNRFTQANYNNGQQVIAYSYDAAGNRTQKVVTNNVDTDLDGFTNYIQA